MAPMKSMKKAMKSSVMTASAAYSSVAETTGLKAKEVKAVVEGLVEVAAGELKKSGSFKLAGALNLKLKKNCSCVCVLCFLPIGRTPIGKTGHASAAAHTAVGTPLRAARDVISISGKKYLCCWCHKHS